MRRTHRAQHVRGLNGELEGDELEVVEGEEGEADLVAAGELRAKVEKIERDRVDALRALGVWDDQ